MKNKKIGNIIFAKVLEMPLPEYLGYIGKITHGSTGPLSSDEPGKKIFYAKTMIKDGTPDFEISDKCLKDVYSAENCAENKIICSLKWINTRNKFSLHILKNLLHYQSKYWFSGRETDIKPLSLKQFLCLYPLQYLDQTRLSRLISNLSVMGTQGQPVDLKSLFISKKKHLSRFIKEIIKNNENTLKDKDIQYLLSAQKGAYLSLRTICNYRKSVNISNYKEREVYYYEKHMAFSDHIMLSKKSSNKIPSGAGVYELGISSKIAYLNHRSNIMYIGSSGNLRKRIANYMGKKLKNNRLKRYIISWDVFVRYYLTESTIHAEKKALRNFKNIYGELPKCNSLGG